MKLAAFTTLARELKFPPDAREPVLAGDLGR
jgi:hypothetical protein